jgi:hypothetical protein
VKAVEIPFTLDLSSNTKEESNNIEEEKIKIGYKYSTKLK